ncbi:MAG TPA: tRNA uridine-5-carboxymethylaminomethyl(34) synthesis GTPase MnmE [Nitrospira sp.]|nr:tRNA uridine-5-carboxymethylaminomethyl(34) synthesis GTPase MnmE [Nitrospira sp.]
MALMSTGALGDTICAIATPAGEGGIGIVRLSGSRALAVAGQLVRLRSGRPLSSMVSHTLHLADIRLPPSVVSPHVHAYRLPLPGGEVFDEALVVFMKAPRSFTGEDTVEIQSHGGGLVLSLICRACIAAGARMAAPGEFTKRAFLNGRIDLSQAEAVLDTIRAKSAAGLTAAQRQLRGELARQVDAAREALLRLLAELEAGIDFVGEDIELVDRQELAGTVDNVTLRVQRLAATAQNGRRLREGARVVILGRPNVGKSSLLNRLLKDDRAIVTPIPGTTRDIIEESVELEGVIIHLVDTAGIRETDDVLEREGIRRSRSAQSNADLQIVVIDGTVPLSDDDRVLLDYAATGKCVTVINKADLPIRVDPSDVKPGPPVVSLSAKTGEGIDLLRAAIRDQLIEAGADTADGVIVTNLRHQAALDRAKQSLNHARQSVEGGMANELVALDIRAAADALGEITGAITTDEILERIFSTFCIGK